jgi:hypothetical protein
LKKKWKIKKNLKKTKKSRKTSKKTKNQREILLREKTVGLDVWRPGDPSVFPT